MAHLRDLIVNGNSRTFGTAYATKFEGPLTGNATSATKATQDGNGNVITSTYATASSLSSHTGNKSNPHGVTKGQVGLGSVANIDQSKAIKSITRSGTTFTATALDGSTTTFTQQDSNTTYGIATSTTPGLIKSGGDVTVDASTGTISINDNSHGHSISNISGLQSALDSKLNTSLKGSKNGLATLDSNGFVPSSQLPSYVDDVIDVSMKSDLTSATNASGATITPETGKIYIDDIGTSATNKTYRWSGTTYVVISETLALGETSSTAFDGARGKVAYNHSQSAHARVDATNTKASTTNGHISINGTDTAVYTHPGYTSHASGLYKVTVDGQGHVSGATAVTKSDITALGIPGQDTNTTYGIATSTTPGLVKSGGNVTVNTDGTMSVSYASSAGSANAVTWTNISGKPSTYAPSSHTHTIAQITNLQSSLDSKATTSHTHSIQNITELAKLKAGGKDTWGNQTGSTVVSLDDPSGGSLMFRQDNPTAGQLSMIIDGTVYVNEGRNAVISTADIGSQSVKYATTAGSANSVAWANISGKPSTYYTHPGYTSHASGLYKVTVDGQGHVSGATAVTKSDITALGIPGQDTNTTYNDATTSAHGLMTAAMVSKLNGIASGANAYVHPSYTAHGTGLYKVAVDGSGHVSGVTAVTKADITALGIPGQDTNTTYTLAGLGGVAKSGDTMRGPLNLANATKNTVGDDVAIGDYNQAGSLGIQGLNGTTTVSLIAQDSDWDKSASHMDMVYNTTDQCCDFKFK